MYALFTSKKTLSLFDDSSVVAGRAGVRLFLDARSQRNPFPGGGADPGVVFFDFATARARRVADLPGAPEHWVGGIALSPDGRSVLFSTVERGTSDIMLIEDFR